MPLYQLLIAFVFFVGFAAVLQAAGPRRRTRPTSRCSAISKDAFPQWFVGLIGSAGHALRAGPGLDAADRVRDDVAQEHLPRR